tara:strand:- start:2476 stop:4269 length:1794 start_codon:yes stop_codon:yes gene_type:complete
MANYESIYPGATFLLDPGYEYMGHTVPTSDLGATTSIQTANQLKEVNNLLNQGIQTTEISTINPEVFEMMPKDHLKEINRLNKLTGAESTMHAPTLDPSGFTQQGWSKSNRAIVEKQFTDFVQRSHELDPNGNIPVTIHASVIPGSEMMPAKGPLVKPSERGKAQVMQKMIAVDQETGQFIPLERDILYSHHEKGPDINTPEERLSMANNSKWIQAVTNLAFYKKEADEILGRTQPQLQPLYDKIEKGEGLTKEEHQAYGPAHNQLQRGELFLQNVDTSFRTIFEQAAKYPHPKYKKETKQALDNISKEWVKLGKDRDSGKIKTPDEYILKQSKLVDDSINKLRGIAPPMAYRKVEEFAKEKASETLSNVAVNTYKKYGATSPIISIENPPYGSAISSAEDLKNLIKDTRRKFTKKLVNQGTSKSEAQRQAKKLIGATWDTSHISMMRKQGFGKKRMIEETRKIAPYVKHVHMNDNFGSTHTDLPAGKGSLPMSEMMKEIDKAKYKGKKIFEGGGFFQHFQTSPMPYVLEGAGSSLYTGGGVSWNQLGGMGSYYSGQGPVNPSIHHSTYGAGFTTLPVELGGEMPGAQSRFSGTPNQ